MHWCHYLIDFLAGVFLANFVPHFIKGVAGDSFPTPLAWRARFVKHHLIKQELAKMVDEGEVLNVQVEGLIAAPLFMLSEQQTDIELSGDAFILSPFDILNVFRHRLKDFFDFDYQIECFVPAPKRKYGYFSLPILLGDIFVGRMDAKADRKQKVLLVHNLHFEDVELTESMIEKLTDALKAFVK